MINAQQCIVYEFFGFEGDSYHLDIGQSVTIHFADTVLANNPNSPIPDTSFIPSTPSWQVQPGAAIQLTWVGTPLSTAYPGNFIYSEKTAEGIRGTSQYAGSILEISCLTSGASPLPTAWIPVDRGNVKDETPVISMEIGDTLLMLRRAFIWENAEDHKCCHGPYASIGLHIHNPNVLIDYDNDFDQIANNYCENEQDTCDFSFECLNFGNIYQKIGGFKLPGPIYQADNLCNDLGQGCFGLFGGAPDPQSEWIDGPWGVCYSRVPIFNWNSVNMNEVAVILREGDESNCDDFLGGGLVNKSDTGVIRFNAWLFGWIEMQNVVITDADVVNSVDVADYYWFYNWDGANPEEIHSIPQTPPYDQFVPFAGGSISEMESEFPDGITVGLIGGVFPKGVMSKPMTYKAACVPAIFGSSSSVNFVGGFSHSNHQMRSSDLATSVFPNPTNDWIHWQNGKVKEVQVFNTNGQLMLSAFDVDRLDFSPFPQGIYFIRFKENQSGQVVFAKVIKN